MTTNPRHAIKINKPSAWDLLRGWCWIDARALVLLRISMGCMLIYDLFGRLQDHQMLYSDQGVFPRALAIAQGRAVGLSIHLASGEPWFQFLLYLIAFAAAGCLVAGYRTRTATIISWILFTSLCSRNPRAMNAGDSLMHVVLLWSMFLPLGAWFAVDANAHRRAHRPPPLPGTASVASAAILIQVFCVYMATAFLKNGDSWSDGSALYYALSLDQFSTPLGRALLSYPGLLDALTHLTILLEFGGPLLLLCPFKKKYLRTVGVMSFVSLHIGIALTMKIGFLPFLDIVALALFLPSEIWDRLYRLPTPPASAKSASLSVNSAPRTPLSASYTVAQAAAGLVLVYMLWWTVGTLRSDLKPPAALRNAAGSLKLNHTWKMFAPAPSKSDGWFIIAAELDNGETVDLLRDGRPVDWSKPADMAATFPNYRHRKYRVSLTRKDTPKPVTSRFVHYYKTLWDKKLEKKGLKIKKARFYFMEEFTMPRGQEPRLKKKLLWVRTR